MARPVLNRKGTKVPGMFQEGGNAPKKQMPKVTKQQYDKLRQGQNPQDALGKAKQDLMKDQNNFALWQRDNMLGGNQNLMLDERARSQAQTYIQGMKDQQSLIATVEAAMRENIELKKQMEVQAAQSAQQQLINSGRKKQKDMTNANTPRQMGGSAFDVINERNKPPTPMEMNPPSNRKMSPGDIRAIKEKAESLRRGGFIKMKYN
jgi:hypothetical protein